jgi:hypothetical protein
VFRDELPLWRVEKDSQRAKQGRLQPGDRHARRLGVLGSVECRLGAASASKSLTPAGHLAVPRGALIALPMVAAGCPEVIGAGTMLTFPMIAA